jgi:uncharacterized membrane protein
VYVVNRLLGLLFLIAAVGVSFVKLIAISISILFLSLGTLLLLSDLVVKQQGLDKRLCSLEKQRAVLGSGTSRQ